jgi:uncharacterized protein YdeI (YjbR/CyaY-like superfamily)
MPTLKPTTKLVTKKFDAVLERSGDSLNWTIIRVPLDVAKVWGVRGQLKVAGEINGFPFRTSLFPTGKGTHVMIVNKKMQKGSGAALGKKAGFRMEPDMEKREVPPSAELERILKQSRPLKKYYESLSYSMRREIAKWIGAGKQAETRNRRAEQIAERVMLIMDAERELPPILQVALARNPVARAGWERMPPSHRRWHLFGIFGYRNPESQQRRIAKAVNHMVEYGKKKSKGALNDEELE